MSDRNIFDKSIELKSGFDRTARLNVSIDEVDERVNIYLGEGGHSYVMFLSPEDASKMAALIANAAMISELNHGEQVN